MREEREHLEREKQREIEKEQYEKIARTKRREKGQSVSCDLEKMYVHNMFTMSRPSNERKAFINNVKNFIRDSEDEEDDERDCGDHKKAAQF